MSDNTSVRKALADATTAAENATAELFDRMQKEGDPIKKQAIRREWDKARRVTKEANDALENSAFNTAGGVSLEKAVADLKERIKKLKEQKAQLEEVAAVLNILSTAIKGVLLFA